MSRSKTRLCCLAMAVMVAATTSGAFALTAPLNGVASVDFSSGVNQLFVTSGTQTISAQQILVIQGDPDTQRLVSHQPGAGTVYVGQVIIEPLTMCDLLYQVIGNYVGGAGASSSTWYADYTGGSIQLDLSVNDRGYGSINNAIIMDPGGAAGGFVIVSLFNGTQGRDYNVTLSQSQGPGSVAFVPPLGGTPTSTVEFNLKGAMESIGVQIIGVQTGEVTLKAQIYDDNGNLVTTSTIAVVVGISIQTVDFGLAFFWDGDIYDVVNDDGSAYSGHDWDCTRISGPQTPICYVAGSIPAVDLSFTVGDGTTGQVMVQGNSDSGITFGPVQANIANGTISLSDLEANEALPDTIDCFDPMYIDWEVSTDGGNTWNPAGTTANQVYVVLNEPLNPKLYHSVVHLSCMSAEGVDDEDEATLCIWSTFQSLVVCTYDGVQLTYYANYQTKVISTTGLLTTGDGQCASWTFLFLDTLLAQGIQQTDNTVIVGGVSTPANVVVVRPVNNLGFFVNNWNNVPTGSTPAYNTIVQYPWENYHSYNFAPAAVTQKLGIPGQGNPSPASVFTRHVFTYLSVCGVQQYYDPSYGQIYNDLNVTSPTFLSMLACFFQIDVANHRLVIYNSSQDTVKCVGAFIYSGSYP